VGKTVTARSETDRGPTIRRSREIEEAMMAGRMMINQWLVPVFLLGCLLFTFPLLSLFNSGDRVFGIPVLYAYLFTAWTLLIALMALAVERRH
jgi:hypothetical protein